MPTNRILVLLSPQVSAKALPDLRTKVPNVTLQRFGHEDGAIGHIQAGANERMTQVRVPSWRHNM